jgi:homoserine kinase
MEAVTVYAPGSASNLGAGFDCLGVAFTGMGDRVLARRALSGIRIARVSDPRLPLGASENTAGIAAGEALRRAGSDCGIELEIDKGLPLSAGLGGSAASAVGGAFAVNALLDLKLSTPELLEVALLAESRVAGRHLDNVAPCLLGGAILVRGIDPPQTLGLSVHRSLRLVLITPTYAVETSRARAVLPESVARATAIGQAAGLGALILGLERADPDLIRTGMKDWIAEPPRLSLYPGYPEARAQAYEAGAFGVSVSGAGPSLISVVPEGAAEAVARALEEGYRRVGVVAHAHLGEVDHEGARVAA